jgi:hypothetical protein
MSDSPIFQRRCFVCGGSSNDLTTVNVKAGYDLLEFAVCPHCIRSGWKDKRLAVLAEAHARRLTAVADWAEAEEAVFYSDGGS